MVVAGTEKVYIFTTCRRCAVHVKNPKWVVETASLMKHPQDSTLHRSEPTFWAGAHIIAAVGCHILRHDRTYAWIPLEPI